MLVMLADVYQLGRNAFFHVYLAFITNFLKWMNIFKYVTYNGIFKYNFLTSKVIGIFGDK